MGIQDIQKLTERELREELKKPKRFKKEGLADEFDRRVRLVYGGVEKDYIKKHGYAGDGVEYQSWQKVLGLNTEAESERFVNAYILGAGTAGDEGACEEINEPELKDLEAAVKKNPKDKKARTDLGTWYSLLRRYPEAIAQYEEVIRQDPADPYTYCMLARAYEGMGKWQEAIGIYRKALDLDPNYADALWCTGNIYLVHGDKKKADTYFKKAKALPNTMY